MKLVILIGALTSFSCFSAEINVPASNILAAARTISAQSGPHYLVTGSINCTAIKSGWGPATSTCTINIKGATAVVDKAENIINKVAAVRFPTGPAYSFSGKFVATSDSAEFPPYKILESAKIILK